MDAMEDIGILIMGIGIGVVLYGLLSLTFMYSLGDDSYLKPKLIEEQCAEYNSTTGDFTIGNLRIIK